MMGAPATATNLQQPAQPNPTTSNDIQTMTTMNDGGTNENIVFDDLNGSTCSTYLSLIQQYLMMFQVDNAIWLAERCIAEYSQCLDAVYLLALAYYRKGKIKNAWHILERKTSTTFIDPSTSNKTLASIQYLSAQCSYELGDYTLGEIALLKGTRKAYKAANTTESIDDWILRTSVSYLFIGSAFLIKFTPWH
jgi:Anaphase-promoting complex, cyclosome, subunit 3